MKRHFSSILLFCFLIQFTGCYTYQYISKEELISYNSLPSIIVSKKDSTKYSFDSTAYHISNDTIYGSSWRFLDKDHKVLQSDRAISLSDIQEIQANIYNGPLTYVVAITVSAGAIVLGYFIYKDIKENGFFGRK